MGSTRKSTILVLNRWDDEFSDYASYIDHDHYRVMYLSTESSASNLPSASAVAIRTITDFSDRQRCAEIIGEMVSQHGPIDKLLALSEYDLDLAGFLRESFGIPGPGPRETAKFRDKVTMKEHILKSGLRAPAFLEVLTESSVRNFVWKFGYPIIFKPRKGAASIGVHKVSNSDQLKSVLQSIDFNTYECEEFVPGEIFHVDGLVQSHQMKLFRLSRYVNTCLDFAKGIPLGSFMVDDEKLLTSAFKFTDAALKALGIRDSAFHLELIRDSRNDQWVFLEVGARVGGGEIPFIIRTTDGIDLVSAWVKILLGEPISQSRHIRSETVGGFVMFPKPSTGSYEVEKIESMAHVVPHLIKEIVPASGQILGKGFSYDEIPGRFHFEGPDSNAVESAIRQLMEKFSTKLKAVTN